ncbi:hypothetical protein PP2015_1071 [Pseudoalteromonas phenolica]|uniref:Uncharacterized protein n=1 Tax=Pseudoalteromonas phenolica TaxID=161398 RepID=A0A0S2K0M2_9GAMM|nr:hypothetical protein PP2015_1071 [Pseudoalteromonas phenolica]
MYFRHAGGANKEVKVSQKALISAIISTLKVYKPKKIKPKFKAKHLSQKQKVQACLKGSLVGLVTLGKLKQEQDKLNQQLAAFFDK